MGYEVNYAEAEKHGCSARVTVANRTFYVKLLESAKVPERFFAADQKGAILKEISRAEFNFWLQTLADNDTDIQDIKQKINTGKKYS